MPAPYENSIFTNRNHSPAGKVTGGIVINATIKTTNTKTCVLNAVMGATLENSHATRTLSHDVQCNGEYGVTRLYAQ